MDFAPGCGPVPVAPSSRGGASRVAVVSPRSTGRPFVSLRTTAQFSAVFRTGRSARCGEIRVICAGGERGLPQVGVVASRRVGGAVTRNRAKRRLREALMRVELKSDTAYVVIASPGVVTMEFDRLVRELGTAIAASGEEENR